MLRTTFMLTLFGAAAAADDAPVTTLYGSGTTNPSRLFWQAMDIIEERSRDPVLMTYRAVGSSTGQKEFLGASNNPVNMAHNDFGSGDIPMTNARYNAVVAAGRSMVMSPIPAVIWSNMYRTPAPSTGSTPFKSFMQ